MEAFIAEMEQILASIPEKFVLMKPDYLNFYISLVRTACPMLALVLLVRCALPLMTFRREPEIWAELEMADGSRIPITHWENVIGRSRSCDVTISLSTVSRNHAVLTRYDDGSWTVTDAGSKDGTFVNKERVSICALCDGDVITIGGVDLALRLVTAAQVEMLAETRTRGPGPAAGAVNLLLLTAFQILVVLGFSVHGVAGTSVQVMESFLGITVLQWVLFLFYLLIRSRSFEIETMAFFLCTMGMAAISTVCPGEARKQLLAIALGVTAFLILSWSLRSLERAKRVRYLAAAAGAGMLAFTMLFGKEYYGARNWLIIGGMSLQPSELAKICFVYAGASTMDRVMNRRNQTALIGYSILVCGMLAVMNDFGTAMVFFCAFLMIAYLRSGSVSTVTLAITALGIAGFLAIQMVPHAWQRFETWGHVWEEPFGKGYQQAQAMMGIASGGLFGLGAGKGWLHHVFAADSDIVFATLSEEWGLALILTAVSCFVVLGIFVMRSARVARSSFYSIGSCTAVGILLVQTIFNCLGTVDLLPFTGVTFPFVSNGGTSMIAAWGLLAFVKAADTRQDASFAVK